MITYLLFAVDSDGEPISGEPFITIDRQRAEDYLNENIYFSETRVCKVMKLDAFAPVGEPFEYSQKEIYTRTRTGDPVNVL